jgi:Tol biopolymer transport system component
MVRPLLLLLFVTLMPVSAAWALTEERKPEPLATPSSGQIAFLRNLGSEDERRRRIVTLALPGGRERTLRMPPGYDVESFSWSPNGRRLVFAAFPRVGRPWLYVANADGTGLRRLRRTARDTLDPTWSPRGDRIAWDNHDDGAHAIWVMKPDGTGARRLTPGFRFANPRWSPDGTRIAYQHLDTGWRYVMKADGSAKRRFTRLPTQEWTRAGFAYRTPEGIGFVSPNGRAGPVVIRVGDEWEWYRLSRDGQTAVLWTSIRPGGDWEIGVATVGGQGVRRLTDNDRHDVLPALSPDGTWLAFEGFRPPGRGEETIPPGDIYVINADGTGERNLTNSPRDESDPAWAPKP